MDAQPDMDAEHHSDTATEDDAAAAVLLSQCWPGCLVVESEDEARILIAAGKGGTY